MKRDWLVVYDGIFDNKTGRPIGNVYCQTEGPGNFTLEDVRNLEATLKREKNFSFVRITNIMMLDPSKET